MFKPKRFIKHSPFLIGLKSRLIFHNQLPLTEHGRRLPISVQLTSIVQISTEKGTEELWRGSSLFFTELGRKNGGRLHTLCEEEIVELLSKKITRKAKNNKN